MINIDELVQKLNIPDGMTVADMRGVVVDVLDMVKASNQAEEAITQENGRLVAENSRLTAQNLELFNRVTSSAVPQTPEKKDEDESEEIGTEDIVNYYN